LLTDQPGRQYLQFGIPSRASRLSSRTWDGMKRSAPGRVHWFVARQDQGSGKGADMWMIGCDFHPRFQQIAFVNTEGGEWGQRRLEHAGKRSNFIAAWRDRRCEWGWRRAGPRAGSSAGGSGARGGAARCGVETRLPPSGHAQEPLDCHRGRGPQAGGAVVVDVEAGRGLRPTQRLRFACRVSPV
jgi:hypothetical protein